MEERRWAYRRRQPEGTVLYEAARDNLATLLAEASEEWRGLPQYVERDFAKYLGGPGGWRTTECLTPLASRACTDESGSLRTYFCDGNWDCDGEG